MCLIGRSFDPGAARRALATAYRATGADPPFGDPGRAHGVPFEGYYWRLAHPGSGLVVVALGAVCAGPRGSWGMVTLAVHPGGFVRTRITSAARAAPLAFGMRAGNTLQGDAAGVAVDMGPDCGLEVRLEDPLGWPRRPFGALGPAHAVPFLSQYWQPTVLTARARGVVRAGGRELRLDGALAYAEKNWGGGFPGHWWWGHAGAFPDDASVSFAGGRLRVPGGAIAPTAVVVRLGRRVLTLAPPAHPARVTLGDGTWRLRVRGPRHGLDLEGSAGAGDAFELLVPVPAEERGEPRSRQHLAGRIAMRVTRAGRLLYRGESPLAGLERGTPLSGASPASRPA